MLRFRIKIRFKTKLFFETVGVRLGLRFGVIVVFEASVEYLKPLLSTLHLTLFILKVAICQKTLTSHSDWPGGWG